MPVPSPLESYLATLPSALVAYSGGVDSALVAVAAHRVLGVERAVAALGVSPSLAQAQRDQAHRVAELFGLRLVEVPTGEFGDPAYVANPVERCYHCKTELWRTLEAEAARRGLVTVLDGTNADDDGEHRPGLRASREWAVRSPLLDLGYSKEAVRTEARVLGIPVWDAPAAPCLSSRVMYGLEVTPRRVRQVEEGEAALRAAGVSGNLRVRHRGTEARIEVEPSQFARVRRGRAMIGRRLLDLGFDRVTLDLRGYRRGSQLERAAGDLETLAKRG